MTTAPRNFTLTGLVAATYFMVAGGPYGLEDIVSKAGYAGTILILLVTPAIWAFPTALMVSELASALPEEGGFYVWVTRGLGPFWGYQEAWLSLVGSIFDMAIYPTLFVSYLGHFVPGLTAGWRATAIAVALVAAAAVWNLLGARTVGGSSEVMAVLLLAPFAVLTVLALFHREVGVAAVAAAPAIPLRRVDVLGGILVAMWNYMAWDNASTVAGEVERPQRTYPRAMAAAVTLVTLSYILPVGAVALTGLDANRWSTGGWADVARAVLGTGPAGVTVALAITMGGMLGAVGTLNAFTMTLSRLPAVLAQDGYLPKMLAKQSGRTGVPWVSLCFCAAGWSLALGLTFTKLIVLDVLLTGLSLMLEFAALVALRIREPELHRPYRVAGGTAGAVALAIAPAALLVLAMIRNKMEPVGPVNALEFGAILIGLGVVAYFVGDRLRSHDSRRSS